MDTTANNLISIKLKLPPYYSESEKLLLKTLTEVNIKNISVWGAGKNGRLLVSMLILNSIEISDIYDDSFSGEIAGIKVSPFNSKMVDKSTAVIIAINPDNPACKKVQNKLNNAGVENYVFGSTPEPPKPKPVIKKPNIKPKTARVLTEEDRIDLLAFKNIHPGKRAFILGNGPSLKIPDLKLLENEITFAANKIYLAFDQTDWRPKYYCMEDHLVAKQNHEKINTLNEFQKFFPHYLKKEVPYFANSCYFNLQWPNWDTPEEEDKPFSTNGENVIYSGATVVYSMIQLAWYMGIKEIYLMGMDFHFQEPEKEVVEGSKVYLCEGEVNHFHPDYRKPGEKWYKPNLARQIRSFTAARETIESEGGKIYNATRGGKLEVFERIDFDKLIKEISNE